MEDYFKPMKARITDLSHESIEDKRSALRLYRTGPYDGYTLQIRANGPFVDGGKPRFAIATVQVTIADLEALLAHAKATAYPEAL
jgi:hypothetical protein